MTKNKKLKELEKRLSALEARLFLAPSAPCARENGRKELSYGEVIYEWLNGKAPDTRE